MSERTRTKEQGTNKKEFTVKVDAATFITSIQRDLLRVHDFAMSQERPTTYVLSDFNLQLKAVVTQQADRPILVFPSRPGEIDPNTMSSINLTLRPVPLAVRPVTKPRPVDSIEGIGPVMAGKLREAGIHTVTDLALASPEALARLEIPKRKADEIIGMARLMVKGDMSGVEGIDEQAAELLVVVARIDSKEKLAQSNPDELYNTLIEAIKSGKVRVPRGYSLAKEDVARWINSSKAIVDRCHTS